MVMGLFFGVLFIEITWFRIRNFRGDYSTNSIICQIARVVSTWHRQEDRRPEGGLYVGSEGQSRESLAGRWWTSSPTPKGSSFAMSNTTSMGRIKAMAVSNFADAGRLPSL